MAAGWSEFDLDWERGCEQVAVAMAKDDVVTAGQPAGAALRLAREQFLDGDPRLATSIANQALCLAGVNSRTADSLLSEARLAWNATQPWIERMQAPRVARSSLFHMRMEQKHRAAYEGNWRIKWRDIANETRQRLLAVDLSSPNNPAAAHEALGRWQRERPAMLNDTRKLLAAAYLLLPGLDAVG